MSPHHSHSSAEHKHKAEKHSALKIAIVTVSDTRTPETDVNRAYLEGEIANAGHTLSAYRIIKDETAQVFAVLDELSGGETQVILFNGGTGISTRDRTFDALSARLEKTIFGFGEIFRMLSYEQVGSAAMLSRATAGVYHGTIIVSTPGSPAAVQLAWEKLIAPEVKHLVWELNR